MPGLPVGSTALTATGMQSTQQSSLGLGRNQQFGSQSGSPATSVQSIQQSSQGLGRNQQFGHQHGSPTTVMQSTQQPWPGHGASQQFRHQLPFDSFTNPTSMHGAQQSLSGSGRNLQPKFYFPPEQFAPVAPSSTANSIDHDQYVAFLPISDINNDR
jgi:hypothetical protein